MATVNMREQMPQTARWVDARRAEWGEAYVKQCVQRAMRREPGQFYAVENGHVLGTPFPATSPAAELQHLAIATGAPFAAFMVPPVDPSCTEPNRARCPRLCSDFCNKAEEAAARQRGDGNGTD